MPNNQGNQEISRCLQISQCRGQYLPLGRATSHPEDTNLCGGLETPSQTVPSAKVVDLREKSRATSKMHYDSNRMANTQQHTTTELGYQ